MLINQAKLELMEKAIKHIGGEIILVPRKNFIFREAMFENRLVWKIARKRNDNSGNFRIIFQRALEGEVL